MVASMVVVATGGSLMTFGPISGLPRPPTVLLLVGFAYWPCFVAIRWLKAEGR